MNMGGCMAPAACDTIWQPSDQDFQTVSLQITMPVITGDLGMVGQRILFDLSVRKRSLHIRMIHQDCGLLIYDNETQDTHSGGSGCGCAASVLAACILPRILTGQLEKSPFCAYRSHALQSQL